MSYKRTGVGSFNLVANVISTTENVNPALNNPGALIYAGQPGASPSSQTFVGSDGRTYSIAQFDTLNDGIAALQAQIALDASRGLTIAQFANKYAPSGAGNNPAAYAQQIAAAAGLSVSDPLAAAADDSGTSASSGNSSSDANSFDLNSLNLNSFDLNSFDLGSLDPSQFMIPAAIVAAVGILWLVSRK